MIISILIVSGVHSQSFQLPSDTITCLPNGQLKTALKLIERGKIDSERVTVQKTINQLLQEQLSNKDSIIAVYEAKGITYSNVIRNYDNQIVNLNQQNAVNEKLVSTLQKDLKRQKHKTTFAIIGGLITTGAAIYLLR